MSGPITIDDDKTAEKRSADQPVYLFDFDQHLAEGVQLTSATFTISPADSVISKDSESLVTGNRSAQLRIMGGKPTKTYQVDVLAVTNETPVQTFDKRFYLFIKP